MKKNLLLILSLLALFGFSSCTHVRYVTKKSTLDDAIVTVKSQFAKHGFLSTGRTSNTKNEPVVTGVSYSNKGGYGTAVANQYITQDYYTFADTIGNTMSYCLKYKLYRTREGILYVEDAGVSSYETNNPLYYSQLFGSDSPLKQINNLPRDLALREYDEIKTYGLILGAAGGICVITLLWYALSK